MPKRHIDTDEWYPVFYITDERFPSGTEVELSIEELADYERMDNEFHNWQEKLRKLYSREDDDELS